MEALAAQEPVLYRSTFPLAQAVAAGDLDIGLGLLHSAQPLVDAGAPIEIHSLDPTPISRLYTVVPSAATSPYLARLFTVWLASDEGARAYEAATGRGNPDVAESETAGFLREHEVSEFGFDRTEEAAGWVARFGAQLRGAGQGALDPS